MSSQEAQGLKSSKVSQHLLENFPEGSNCALCLHRKTKDVAQILRGEVIGDIQYIEPFDAKHIGGWLFSQRIGCSKDSGGAKGICIDFKKDPSVRLMFPERNPYKSNKGN